MADKINHLNEIFRQHGIALAYVFGSMANVIPSMLKRGHFQIADPLADIDLGVVLANPTDLLSAASRAKLYATLFHDLTEVFPENRLDLVLLQETHSVFQAQAITGFCIYADSSDFKSSYEERVLARAADFRPFLERYYEERMEGMTL